MCWFAFPALITMVAYFVAEIKLKQDRYFYILHKKCNILLSLLKRSILLKLERVAGNDPVYSSLEDSRVSINTLPA